MGRARARMPGRSASRPEDTEPRSAAPSGRIQFDEHVLNTYQTPGTRGSTALRTQDVET